MVKNNELSKQELLNRFNSLEEDLNILIEIFRPKRILTLKKIDRKLLKDKNN